jgi:hypothetical protein
VDGKKDRPTDEPDRYHDAAPIDAPNTAAHEDIPNSQQAISEKTLVDRIDRSDRWMIVLTAVIALSTLVSAVIFGKQLIAMHGQLNEMRATREGGDAAFAAQLAVMRDQAKAMQGQLDQTVLAERPWVMLTDIKPQSLSSDDRAGVFFLVNLAVKNVGHLPAQNVSVIGEVLIHEPLQLPEQAMRSVCHEAHGSFVIPGQVIFPDQTQNVDGDNPGSFGIVAEKIWAARDARIKSVDRAQYLNPALAEAVIAELSKFPFYAPLDLVGCINYRSSDNSALYQTGFIFSIATKPNGNLFPLLSGEPVPDTSPDISDPDVMVLHGRRLQRNMPGDEVQLGRPSYGSFVN